MKSGVSIPFSLQVPTFNIKDRKLSQTTASISEKTYECVSTDTLTLLVPEEENDLQTISVGKATISIYDRKVYVSNAETFEIYDVEGRRMPTNARLETGLYIVKTDNESTKILIE